MPPSNILFCVFALFLLPTALAYAGHPDGIMRGNRPLHMNSKYSSTPNDDRIKASAAPASMKGRSRNHLQAQPTSYFEELWGNVAGVQKVPYARLCFLFSYLISFCSTTFVCVVAKWCICQVSKVLLLGWT